MTSAPLLVQRLSYHRIVDLVGRKQVTTAQKSRDVDQLRYYHDGEKNYVRVSGVESVCQAWNSDPALDYNDTKDGRAKLKRSKHHMTQKYFAQIAATVRFHY